mgnify:CR=1 FL=1
MVKAKTGEPASARFVWADADCLQDAAPPGALPGLAAVERLNCKQAASALRTDLLIGRRGERTFAATGLSAYSKALELGIASLASDSSSFASRRLMVRGWVSSRHRVPSTWPCSSRSGAPA